MTVLTNKEIDNIKSAYHAVMLGDKPYFPWFDYARAIEQAVLDKQKEISLTHPIIPDTRLLDIIRGYISEQSTDTTGPDMHSEKHLLVLARIISDEAAARYPLWALERQAEASELKKEREHQTRHGGYSEDEI